MECESRSLWKAGGRLDLAKSAAARHPAKTQPAGQKKPDTHGCHIIAPVLKVGYRYADAGNYKFWGEFHVLGELKLEDLQPYLIGTEFFVPERIGLPSLVPEIKNEDDHLLHTFEEFAKIDSASYECTAAELIQRIRLADKEGWFTGFF